MDQKRRVAIVWYGDRDARRTASAGNNKFSPVFREFSKYDVLAEPAVYHDAARDEVWQQLREVDGVLVWVNPIQEDGHDRALLDEMLRDVASHGIFVSTGPDVILKLGTKEVLYRTRDMGWGGDVHLYETINAFCEQFPARLARGKSRVLKQNRGNGGNGVWRVEQVEGAQGTEPIVRVLHALRGSAERQIPLRDFMSECEPYFAGTGQMIDQPFHSPLPDGMVRCYMSHGEVVGFGHQYVTALLRPEPGEAPLEPTPRIYHPDTNPEFQTLKAKMETEWLPHLQTLLDIETHALPIIWDADFLYGPKTASGEETFVLCEINVSCVSPFPDSALPRFVKNMVNRLPHRRV